MKDSLKPVIQLIKTMSAKDRVSLSKFLEEHLAVDSALKIELSDLALKQRVNCCPNCQGTKIIKWGNYANRKRYRCQNCNKTFTGLTGTALHYLHDHKKVLNFLNCMLAQKTLKEAANYCNICIKTAFDWRHKFMHALHLLKQDALVEEVQADETFIPLSYKGQRNLQKQISRKSFKRAAKRPKKRNLAIVLTAIDTKGHLCLKHKGTGTLTKKMVQEVYSKIIRKQKLIQKKRLKFYTDRHISYKKFAQKKRLEHSTIAASYGQHKNIDGASLALVNNLHAQLKKWLVPFCGIATKYLQRYLDLFKNLKACKSSKTPLNYFLSNLLKFNIAFIPIYKISQ